MYPGSARRCPRTGTSPKLSHARHGLRNGTLAALSPAEWVEAEFGYSFRDASLLQSCFTPRRVNPERNYELLEFYGDAVLSLALTRILVELHPKHSYAEIDRRRSQLCNNTKLRTMAELKGIELALKGAGLCAASGPTEAAPSDVVEAVIGGICMDGGYENAEESVAKFYGKEELCSGGNAESSACYVAFLEARGRHEIYKNGRWWVDRSWSAYDKDELHHLSASLENLTGYEFQNPDLCFWMIAPSAGASSSLDGNFNNLQSLGCMAVRGVAINELMAMQPRAQEGRLSVLRDAIMSDKWLAGRVERKGLDAFLSGIVRDGAKTSHGGRLSKEFVADYLKVVAGAVFVDGGLGAVRELDDAIGMFNDLDRYFLE